MGLHTYFRRGTTFLPNVRSKISIDKKGYSYPKEKTPIIAILSLFGKSILTHKNHFVNIYFQLY